MMKLPKFILITMLYALFIGYSHASPPTGENLTRILLNNKDNLITSQSGWCNSSNNKPFMQELVRVLSPQSHFEDNINENIHFNCSESNHQVATRIIPVWECQLGIVETKTDDKNYFTSRSIFVALDKKDLHLYMDSIRCLD